METQILFMGTADLLDQLARLAEKLREKEWVPGEAVRRILGVLGWSSELIEENRVIDRFREEIRIDYVLRYKGRDVAYVFITGPGEGAFLDDRLKEILVLVHAPRLIVLTNGVCWKTYWLPDSMFEPPRLIIDIDLLRGRPIGLAQLLRLANPDKLLGWSLIRQSYTMPVEEGRKCRRRVVLTEYIRSYLDVVPRYIFFPDGSTARIRHRYEILTAVARWLYEKGLLKPSDLPIKLPRGKNYVLNTVPLHPGKKRFRAPKRIDHGVYLERVFDSRSVARRIIYLLRMYKVPLDRIEFCIE